jgi:hypothetical protein
VRALRLGVMGIPGTHSDHNKKFFEKNEKKSKVLRIA